MDASKPKRSFLSRLAGRDRTFDVLFKILGPPTVENAVQGTSAEAREGWRRDLAERKRFSAEQRARRAERRRGGNSSTGLLGPADPPTPLD
ncbi:hypothetical protein BDK92_2211 [Micromonospora pisi]|uniref:Uncharacterized protein n=1 Tax=Micromonospora pisi TaxID=589240 RepID=A0A495JH65_9ACTN|nr:hypothetical protein [Micromonospora pisi]RKR87908.1 hypothetical protein BDK92_2211 [Micromonospora pisi]